MTTKSPAADKNCIHVQDVLPGHRLWRDSAGGANGGGQAAGARGEPG